MLGSLFTTGLKEAMELIGFEKKTRHYIHPECPHLFVEFPGTIPLGIGDDYSIVPDEVDVDGIKIKIYSPTDCVKDRLATFIYFKDRDGLDQAVMVANKHPVNLKSIKDWCINERSEEHWEEFLSLIQN